MTIVLFSRAEEGGDDLSSQVTKPCLIWARGYKHYAEQPNAHRNYLLLSIEAIGVDILDVCMIESVSVR
jgi:FMN-dependent NADH-azoreductase